MKLAVFVLLALLSIPTQAATANISQADLTFVDQGYASYWQVTSTFSAQWTTSCHYDYRIWSTWAGGGEYETFHDLRYYPALNAHTSGTKPRFPISFTVHFSLNVYDSNGNLVASDYKEITE